MDVADQTDLFGNEIHFWLRCPGNVMLQPNSRRSTTIGYLLQNGQNVLANSERNYGRT